MLCFSRTCVVLTMTAVCMLRILFTCSFSGTSPFCLEPTPLGYREERLWCWRHGQTRVCPATRVSLQDRSQVQEVLQQPMFSSCQFSFECMWLDSEALYDDCFHDSGPSCCWSQSCPKRRRMSQKLLTADSRETWQVPVVLLRRLIRVSLDGPLPTT